MITRVCLQCAKPLVRRKGETASHFTTRRYCDKGCDKGCANGRRPGSLPEDALVAAVRELAGRGHGATAISRALGESYDRVCYAMWKHRITVNAYAAWATKVAPVYMFMRSLPPEVPYDEVPQRFNELQPEGRKLSRRAVEQALATPYKVARERFAKAGMEWPLR